MLRTLHARGREVDHQEPVATKWGSWLWAGPDRPCLICGSGFATCLLSDDFLTAICSAVRSDRPAGGVGWTHTVNGTGAATAGSNLLVCDGELITTIVQDLGFAAVVGGPGVADLVRRLNPPTVTVVVDQGESGERHARSLAGRLLRYCADVRVAFLPVDIVRREDVLRLIESAEPCRTRVAVTGGT